MDRQGVEVHKLAKKERGQYPAILTEQAWSIKDLLYGINNTIFLREKAENARSGSQSQKSTARYWVHLARSRI